MRVGLIRRCTMKQTPNSLPNATCAIMCKSVTLDTTSDYVSSSSIICPQHPSYAFTQLQVLLDAHFKLILYSVTPVVIAFNILDNALHFLSLSLPLFLSHLAFSVEKLCIRFSVASAHPIPDCGVLSIIVVEVQVVHSVASSTVENGTICNILTIMNNDSPDVDKHKQPNVCKLLHREKEWEDVVWHRLKETVYGVEGMRSIGSRHDPLMMRLMQTLVKPWVV